MRETSVPIMASSTASSLADAMSDGEGVDGMTTPPTTGAAAAATTGDASASSATSQGVTREASITSLRESTAARSQMFWNSRTLPGHG